MEYKPQRISKLIEDIETFFILTIPIKIEIEKNKKQFPIKAFAWWQESRQFCDLLLFSLKKL